MQQALKTLIIEDETLAAQRLQKLLAPHEQEIEVVGLASNGQEGLQLIEELDPDVIFLDIQMPVINGLEMLMQLDKQPLVVFTTAYDEYALQSFEQNSIDYLLKPIQPDRLQKTINKLVEITGLNREQALDLDQLQRILGDLQKPKVLNVIRANVGDRIVIIKIEQIQYFKAEDKLTTVVTTDNKEYFITPALSTLLAKLPDNFIQINRAHIINEEYVSEIRKGFNRKLVFEMKNTEKIAVGAAFVSRLKERWAL